MIVKEESNIYGLIKILNEESYTVIHIGDEYWQVVEFHPGDERTPYHKLMGRLISTLLFNNINLGVGNKMAFVQKMEAISISTIQYSKDHSYKWLIK